MLMSVQMHADYRFHSAAEAKACKAYFEEIIRKYKRKKKWLPGLGKPMTKELERADKGIRVEIANETIVRVHYTLDSSDGLTMLDLIAPDKEKIDTLLWRKYGIPKPGQKIEIPMPDGE